jgi:hypothetical protein
VFSVVYASSAPPAPIPTAYRSASFEVHEIVRGAPVAPTADGSRGMDSSVEWMDGADHAGTKTGALISGDSSWNVTRSAMPMRSAPGSQSTMFVIRRGPSSSSTTAAT